MEIAPCSFCVFCLLRAKRESRERESEGDFSSSSLFSFSCSSPREGESGVFLREKVIVCFFLARGENQGMYIFFLKTQGYLFSLNSLEKRISFPLGCSL